MTYLAIGYLPLRARSGLNVYFVLQSIRNRASPLSVVTRVSPGKLDTLGSTVT
jgi:hypothetical protein